MTMFYPRRSDTYIASILPYMIEARESGARTLASMARYLNDRSIAAPMGGSFRANTVQNVINRDTYLDDAWDESDFKIEGA